MIQLRPTREADLPFVLHTERDPSNTSFISQWSLEKHDSALRDPDIGHWIIESVSDQRPLGYLIAIGLTDGNGRINLRRIVVACKGKGIGRQALRAFHRKAFGELGAAEIWLIVYQRNERAQSLYRSEGYAEVGLSPSGREEKQHIVMALDRERMGSLATSAEDRNERGEKRTEGVEE
jgi:diamine N-acetyltransferase